MCLSTGAARKYFEENYYIFTCTVNYHGYNIWTVLNTFGKRINMKGLFKYTNILNI